MNQITVGTWGEAMASGVLQDAGRAAGLVDGERVEIEAKDGDIVIRRARKTPVKGSPEALAAVERLIENSRGVTLGDVTIRDLMEEGRRG
jgi:antitoxin component of MazEF toxin-antitoxin module